jgi:hypothetical protein
MPKAPKASISFRARVRAEEEYERGVAWCIRQDKGSRACIKALVLENVKRSEMQRRVTKTRQKGAYRRFDFIDKRRLLTLDEEGEFAVWLGECARGHSAKFRPEQMKKILEILQLRKQSNRRGGRQSVPLSTAAKQALETNAVNPAFFRRFFKEHDELKEKVPRAEDAKRAAAACDETVETHFEAKAGIRNELLDAGIMQPSGVILEKDKPRVINVDEMPQFADFNANKGNAQAQAAMPEGMRDSMSITPKNRECHTVDMSIGLDGFMYGLILLLREGALLKAIYQRMLMYSLTRSTSTSTSPHTACYRPPTKACRPAAHF